MKVKNHLLEGDEINHRNTPNVRPGLVPRYLVFHFTAGRNAKSSINWLCNPEAKASAHIVISEDGSITQLAPFNKKTWHAGRSHWNGLRGMNSHSIGIEISNAGRLKKINNRYVAWFGGSYSAEDVIKAKHKNEGNDSYWHEFTEAQIEASLKLAKLLVKEYDLIDILGHEDISPGRKSDPGPAFPMEDLKSEVMGNSIDEDEVYEVTVNNLNIRKGPGVEFETVSSPLSKGTKVDLIEVRSRWSKVDVEGENDLEGWVYNKYIEQV